MTSLRRRRFQAGGSAGAEDGDEAADLAAEGEVAAAADDLRVSYRALTAAAAVPSGPGGHSRLLTQAERGAVAEELLAGRRADSVLAHVAAWLLLPSGRAPRPDMLLRLGLEGAPAAALELLEQVVNVAALVRRTCARVMAGRGGAAAAEVAAVELAEWDLCNTLDRAKILDPMGHSLRLRHHAVEEERAAVRTAVVDLLVSRGGTVAAAPSSPPAWGEAGPAELARASQILRVLQDCGVLRWLAAAQAARGQVVRAAVRRLAAEAAAA